MSDSIWQLPPTEPTRLVLLKPGDVLAIGNLGHRRADDGLMELLERMRADLGLSLVYAFAEDITLEAVPLTHDEAAAYIAAHPEVAERARELARGLASEDWGMGGCDG